MTTKSVRKVHRLRTLLGAAVVALAGNASTAMADDGYAPILSPDQYQQQMGDAFGPVMSEYPPQPSAAGSGQCQGCGVPSSMCGCEADLPGLPYESKHCQPAISCLPPWWAHRSGVFGEFLLLRPGSTDLIYAVEQTDPDPTVASPTGPVGIAGIDEEIGFRVGGTLAASDCSSMVLAYSRWDGDTQSSLTANGANVLDSRVIHPSTLTSGAASLSAAADHAISFQTADIAYRHLWKASETTALNWLAGVRYGNIEQSLSASQTVQVATGLTNVRTDIDFDGFGITGGLDFERYSCHSGLSIYGKGMVSLLAGEWDATYDQTNQFGGGVIANRYEDYHVTPVLDAELGLSWTAKQRHLRLHTGLLVSGWYEAVTTRSYVDAVRSGNLTDVGETMTFSGLTAGAQWRF